VHINSSVSQGTVWTGKVWYVYEMNKYEFDLSFDIPISYPATSPELALPELDGKTAKMYRGGKICLTVSALACCKVHHIFKRPGLLMSLGLGAGAFQPAVAAQRAQVRDRARYGAWHGPMARR
jgi:hypothetical protein